MARVLKRGCEAYPQLLELVDSSEELPGFVSPFFSYQIHVGDVAAFALAHADPIGWQQAIDEVIAVEWARRGVVAYYELVKTNSGRHQIRVALQKNIRCRTVKYVDVEE